MRTNITRESNESDGGSDRGNRIHRQTGTRDTETQPGEGDLKRTQR